jgi:hypothetical protein
MTPADDLRNSAGPLVVRLRSRDLRVFPARDLDESHVVLVVSCDEVVVERALHQELPAGSE